MTSSKAGTVPVPRRPEQRGTQQLAADVSAVTQAGQRPGDRLLGQGTVVPEQVTYVTRLA